MVFSSMVFLWIFLPVVIVLSLLTRNIKAQNIMLLVASLIFYAWGEPTYIFLLLASVIMNWALGIGIERFVKYKKQLLVLDIIGNLLVLGYFKYCNFAINTLDHLLPVLHLSRTNIALPMGISFFTFRAMSYVIDLYRGHYKAEKNILNLGLYISFFPQLLAGPIVKYRDINEQITVRTVNREKMVSGFRRFIYGLGKKVIISNLLSVAVDKIFALDMSQMTSLMAWCGAVFYTIQIYYDFSGYSDMAIGLSKMFGFDVAENFNYPYISSSVREFWRRWHISLSSWFKEYLYIPLGGNRKGTFRTYLNLVIVFAVTGLWHGASWNFVGWGLYHGAFLVFERMGFGKILDKSKVFSRIYCMIVVMVGWIFFRVDSVGMGLQVIVRMVMPWKYNTSAVAIGTLISTPALVAGIIGILGCGMLQKIFGYKKFAGFAAKWKNSFPEAIYCCLIFLYCILLLANNTYNPFIYFRF